MNKSFFMNEYEKLMKEISNINIMASTDDNDKSEQKAILSELIENNLKPLYRFRKFNDYSLQSFKNDTIYHSHPNDFNDPHDCLIYINENECEKLVDKTFSFEKYMNLSAKEFLQAFLEKFPMFNFIQNYSEENHAIQIEQGRKFLDTLKSEFKKSNLNLLTLSRNSPKISCYSEDISSTLMWSHYADYHKGFALEYDFKNIYKDNAKIILLPIIYCNERYDATNMAIFNFLFDYYYEDKASKYQIIEILTLFNLYLHKGLEWQYEKEWRSFLVNKESMFCSMKPKAVYLGVEMPVEHQAEIKVIAIQKKIPIYKMYIDLNQKEYKLKMNKL